MLGYAPLNAQWSVGALLGLNIASVSVDPEPSSEDYTSRARFAVGGVVDYELNDNMAVRAMPMIMGKGATIEENGEKAAFKL